MMTLQLSHDMGHIGWRNYGGQMNTLDRLIEKYGLKPCAEDLGLIRRMLSDEIAKEKAFQGGGDTEVMKLLCVYLYFFKNVQDVLLVWSAKTSSMDADASLDIQLLCGSGLAETKEYLANHGSVESLSALARINECISAGDFENYDYKRQLSYYEDYYLDE